jgi:hypothetical protein
MTTNNKPAAKKSLHTYEVVPWYSKTEFGEDFVRTFSGGAFSLRARGDGTALKLAVGVLNAMGKENYDLAIYRVVNGVREKYSIQDKAKMERALHFRNRRYR